MSKSLRDQLVASGLATQSQAKKAAKQAQAEARARGEKEGGLSAKERARKVAADKARQDRERATRDNKPKSERAIRAEIRQLIAQHDQRAKEVKDDDVPYNFLHKKKIKRIYVPEKQREQLSKGQLVIINNDGIYHLVDKSIAARIAERDPKRIIAAHEDKRDVFASDDEHYAQFKVPDDLDW